MARDPVLVSVVAPMYEEEATASTFVARVREALDGVDFELVVVDDGSSDRTGAVLAAEAAADAAIAWRDQGAPRRSAAALRLASNLADRCERPATPALSETRRVARLTRAERTAALLAANGRTSRQIAEELVVSVRTVENHLQHVYEKLGIRGRAELREVEGLSER
jgi:DNA-binding CsgD family transcriptional regulator